MVPGLTPLKLVYAPCGKKKKVYAEFAAADMEDLDFNGFLKLLRVNSMDSLDSLDQYDSRLNSSANLQGLESNPSGHGNQDSHYSQLESVPD